MFRSAGGWAPCAAAQSLPKLPPPFPSDVTRVTVTAKNEIRVASGDPAERHRWNYRTALAASVVIPRAHLNSEPNRVIWLAVVRDENSGAAAVNGIPPSPVPTLNLFAQHWIAVDSIWRDTGMKGA